MFSLSALICNLYSRINELILTNYEYIKLQFSYAFNKDQLNYDFPCNSTEQLRACKPYTGFCCINPQALFFVHFLGVSAYPLAGRQLSLYQPVPDK